MLNLHLKSRFHNFHLPERSDRIIDFSNITNDFRFWTLVAMSLVLGVLILIYYWSNVNVLP